MTRHSPLVCASRLASLIVCNALVVCMGLALTSCGTPGRGTPGARAFNFETDTFAFANQLVWEYHYDENGKWVSHPRNPKPDYSHHCFVVARSACQFFERARFDASQPAVDADTYLHLVNRVLADGPNHCLAESERIVIPGYSNLRKFSEAQAALLKSACGGAWHSYFQHGHWRMIFPFSRRHQQKMSMQLVEDIRENHPAVVHVVRFPQLTINHAIVLFAARETERQILFSAYDPNNPAAPVVLSYDRAARAFTYPANDYFPGGRVDIYEVYRDWLH